MRCTVEDQLRDRAAVRGYCTPLVCEHVCRTRNCGRGPAGEWEQRRTCSRGRAEAAVAEVRVLLWVAWGEGGTFERTWRRNWLKTDDMPSLRARRNMGQVNARPEAAETRPAAASLENFEAPMYLPVLAKVKLSSHHRAFCVEPRCGAPPTGIGPLPHVSRIVPSTTPQHITKAPFDEIIYPSCCGVQLFRFVICAEAWLRWHRFH